MTKDELWATYVAKNPSFNGDGNITLSAKGLRKLYDQTWKAAYDAGGGSLMDDILGDRGKNLTKDGRDIFTEMFGGKFAGGNKP